MTNTFQKIFILVLLTALMGIAQPSQSIVGSWADSDESCRWTFRADGTGFMERFESSSTARFNWTVRENVLELSTAVTSVPYEVVQYDGQNLLIRNTRLSKQYQLKREK